MWAEWLTCRCCIACRMVDNHDHHPCHRRCLQADVVVRGYSGYNLVWVQHLIAKVFPKDSPVKPALVTVFFGANDAALAGGVK